MASAPTRETKVITTMSSPCDRVLLTVGCGDPSGVGNGGIWRGGRVGRGVGGICVGSGEGKEVGAGVTVGTGEIEGDNVGACEGERVGTGDGSREGLGVGIPLGGGVG